MIDLGLRQSEWDELIDVLTFSHTYRVRTYLTDRSGDVVDDLTDFVQGGSVSVDVTQPASRTVSLTLFDPNRDINLGSAFVQRMLAINYDVHLPSTGRLVSIPVARAPITAANPQGAVYNLTAVGKAALCSGSLTEHKVLTKGTLVTDAITRALHTWSGIALRDFSLPKLRATLHRDVNARVGTTPWIVVSHLAESVGRDLFFDGAGKLQMRETPTTPDFNFNDDMVIGGFPTATETIYDGNFLKLPNVATVYGANPKVHATAYADRRSLISKQSLAVNDVDFAVVGIYENPFVIHNDVCLAIAERHVARSAETALSFSFDAPVFPFFDENDRVSVHTYGLTAQFNLQQFAFPLGVNDRPTMSIGANKRVSMAGAAARR